MKEKRFPRPPGRRGRALSLFDFAHAIGNAIAEQSQAGVQQHATALFRRCLTRPPISDELGMLVTYYESQKQRLAAKELDAEKIAGPGSTDPLERAAWTLTARAVLNLDETITKE